MKLVKMILPAFLFFLIYNSNFEKYLAGLVKFQFQQFQFNNDLAENKILKKDFKLLILGDSTTLLSVDSKIINNETINLSGWGASTMESYFYFKKYLDNRSPPKCLILSNSFNNELHFKDKFWKIYVFNNFYSFIELNNIYNLSKEFKSYPSSEYNKFIFFIDSALTKLKLMNFSEFVGVEDSIWILKNEFSFERQRYFSSYGDLIETNGYVRTNSKLFSKDTSANENAIKKYHISQIGFGLQDYFLKKIVEKSKELKIKLFFLPPPLINIPNTFDSNVIYNDLTEHVKSLNFRQDELYMLDPIETNHRNFYDISHMNNKEAILYTLKLKSQIEKLCPL